MILYRILAILIGYGCGLFTFGYIIGKATGNDITKKGSGNIGATNTLRILGVKPAAFAMFFDIIKAIIPAVIVYFIFRGLVDKDSVKILTLYASFGAILGHDFPFYLKFKGGKGIDTTFGMSLVGFPIAAPILIATFFITVFITKYVSLSSILACAALAIQTIVFCLTGVVNFGPYQYEAMFIGVFSGVLAIVKHHANIGRLIHHTESKLSFHHDK